MTNPIYQSEISLIGEIFLKHRGRENALTKEQLFKAFYGENYEPKNARIFYAQLNKWKHLRRLMKYMRLRGEHFIIYEPVGFGRFKYYLLNSENEGELFKRFLQRLIDTLQLTQDKCDEYMQKRFIRVRVKARKLVKKRN